MRGNAGSVSFEGDDMTLLMFAAGLVALILGADLLVRGDLWMMSAVALACVPVFLTGREITRWEGAVFLGY